MRWNEYEEDTLKAFTYKTDAQISEYLQEKGYERTPKQIAAKRSRMGLFKSGQRRSGSTDD